MKKQDFISDLLAGLSVSFTALALGAAFGVMFTANSFAINTNKLTFYETR